MKKTLCILLLSPFAQLMSQGVMTTGSGTISTTATTHITIAGNGNLSNDGTITLANGSWVHFSGTTQKIKGNNALNFDNLEVNGTALNVGRNIDVRTSLLMTAGFFDLKESTVTLSSTGNVNGGETNSKRVRATNNSGTEGQGNGTIQITVDNPSGNVANLGVDFAPASALGTTTIIRGHKELQGTGDFSGNYSVYRYYDITPSNQGNLTIDRFYYFTDELGTQAAYTAELQLFQKHRQGAAVDTWMAQTTIVNASYVSSAVQVSDRPSFLFTLGSKTVPLPVELVTFTAHCSENGIVINWQTASETNAAYFTLEKSGNGIDYTPITQVNAQGNSNTLTNYQSIDENINGISYYRLIQYDFNGEAHAYQPISAICSVDAADNVIPIYQNNDKVLFEVTGKQDSPYLLKISNSIGQLIASMPITLGTNHEKFAFDELQLAKGVYFISLISSESLISKPFVIQR